MHVDPQLAAVLESLNNPSLPGIDLSLTRVEQLLAALNNPQNRLPPIIHVAGTNGKGSTIAFMRAMLEAAGKRVHVYTSPHLVHFNERIVLAGEVIDDDALLRLLKEVQVAAKDIAVTFFEATTAAAFLAFSRAPADYLLLEVGMGGRLDATNLVTPIASVITPVALDHQEFLGSNLAAIAAEKAGIIKPHVPAIAGVQAPAAMQVIEQTAVRLGANLIVADAPDCIQPGLVGEHQRANAALAIATLQAVANISDTAIAAGLASVRWPARLQKLVQGPLTEIAPAWLDGGHNAHAAAAIAAWAKTQPRPLWMVCGLMARKDATAFFAPLNGAIDHVITIPITEAADAQNADILAQAARAVGLSAQPTSDFAAALELLKRGKPATVLVAGSLHLAGEVLKTHE